MGRQNRQSSAGFTIIEVIIFLVISASLFGVAVLTISAQNRKTQFTQAVRSFELSIQDTLNDVGTGYYPSLDDLDCSLGATGQPNVNTVPAGSKQKGTNEKCIFIGKAIQFRPSGSPGGYNIMTLVGRKTLNNKDVTSLAEALPKALTNNLESKTIDSGLTVTRVVVDGLARGGFAIVSGFAQNNTATTLKSGIVRIGLYRINNTNINQTPTNFATSASTVGNYTTLGSQGITVCLRQSGANGRAASVSIGVDNQQFATSTLIDPPTGVGEVCP